MVRRCLWCGKGFAVGAHRKCCSDKCTKERQNAFSNFAERTRIKKEALAKRKSKNINKEIVDLAIKAKRLGMSYGEFVSKNESPLEVDRKKIVKTWSDLDGLISMGGDFKIIQSKQFPESCVIGPITLDGVITFTEMYDKKKDSCFIYLDGHIFDDDKFRETECLLNDLEFNVTVISKNNITQNCVSSSGRRFF